MRLAELVPQRLEFKFGSAVLHLRYDMAALLELEQNGYDYADIFGEENEIMAAAFFKAGLAEDIGEDRRKTLFSVVGAKDVTALCRSAMLLALPEPDPLLIPQPHNDEGGEADYGRLLTLVCDVMRKPEEFFWHSTLRELLMRWQGYGIAMNYIKPPERMVMYDTGGM